MLDYNLYIFDFDGTLVDSSPAIISSFKYVLKEFNLDIPKEDVLKTFIGPILRDTYGEYFSLSGKQLEQALQEHTDYFKKNSANICQLFPDVKKTLTLLKQKGRLAIATSRYTYEAKQILESQNVLELFNYIKGADKNQSSSNKTNLYQDVLEHFKLPYKSCLIVGDSKFDIEAANNLGVDSIFVTYGYGTLGSLANFKPSFIFNSLSEVNNFVVK